MTTQTPTLDEPVDPLSGAGRRYAHIDAIEDPEDRLQAAREALLALVPAGRRADAGSLACTIEQAGRFSESAFMGDVLCVVARHFGPLELRNCSPREPMASGSRPQPPGPPAAAGSAPLRRPTS